MSDAGRTDIHLLIQALADGELDAAAALDAERLMAGDPALKAEHDRILALRGAIARLPRPEPGEAFLRRIAALDGSGASPSRPAAFRLPAFDWRAMAASVATTAVLASGLTYWAMTGTGGGDFADAVANDHRRSLLAASPVDVASSDRHTVKPWFDARIGLSPPAIDLARDGFTLVGGRVEVIDGRPLPALVYRHREHLITLVAEPRRNGAGAPAAGDLSAGGFALVRWSDKAFSYWAISDMERSELDQFAALFRAAAAKAEPASQAEPQ
jgi:anti-sigma factor RsiW